jgi:hypothetical protein
MFFIHLFTYAYIVWVISLPCPCHHPIPTNPPHFQAAPVLLLSLILLKRRHKHKKDKAFLLVDLKSAYDGEHTIFGLLSLANLAQNDVLQLNPFSCE